jgi:hypothetical protein
MREADRHDHLGQLCKTAKAAKTANDALDNCEIVKSCCGAGFVERVVLMRILTATEATTSATVLISPTRSTTYDTDDTR